MAEQVKWTSDLDGLLFKLRAKGATWDVIAAAFGLGRETVRERGRRIGARVSPPPELAAPRFEFGTAARPPLPAGHEISWGLLTRGTLLDGEAYPLPLFS